MSFTLLIPKSRLRKAVQSGLLIAFVSACLVSMIYSMQGFQRLEWMTYDWRMANTSDETKASDDVAIILIDDASLQAMESVVGRWPWPRSVYADMIDFLAYGNPKAIIFDLLFSETETGTAPESASQEAINDQRLIEATRQAGTVFHAMQLMTDTEDSVNPHATNPSLPEYFAQNLKLDSRSSWLPPTYQRLQHQATPATYNNFLIPIDGLYQAAAGIGVVAVNSDSDGVLRRIPLALPYQGNNYPALSLAPLAKQTSIESNGSSPTMQIPVDMKGDYLVNFYRHFDTYSASGVLASIDQLKRGDVENLLVDPEEFSGKYVFIGASAVGLHDLKTTPVAERLPGVSIHAAVLDNILTGDFLIPPRTTETLAAIFLLVTLSCLIVTCAKSLSLKTIAPLLLMLLYIAWSVWQFQRHQVVEIVAPLMAATLGWFSAFIFLLFTEGKERHKIRAMFSQYVSPAALAVMVDQYEDYATANGGSTETVSILFSDIRGFTTLSESLPPERVVEMLNHYFSSMTEAVFHHHGTIDKFIGDAIMAIWGAPIRSSTHATDAVAAAFEMIQRLDRVNTWLSEHGFEPIQIGIGINTGQVVLGSIGSEHKADYTVIGDNVNLASRLEGLTKMYGCDILISEYTYQQLGGAIPCRPVDMVRVKGKHHPIRLYNPILAPGSGVEHSLQAQAMVEKTDQAFRAYLQQDWPQAARLYAALADDPLARLFQARIANYQSHPPGSGWDGVHTMTSK